MVTEKRITHTHTHAHTHARTHARTHTHTRLWPLQCDVIDILWRYNRSRVQSSWSIFRGVSLRGIIPAWHGLLLATFSANQRKKDQNFSKLKPVLNIHRTVRRTMIRFLIELSVRRTWFGHFDELYFILSWLVMRCKLRPELAADAQQTAWSKM